MTRQTVSEICTAGALVRHHVRAMLDAAGVDWTEHKAWTRSTFVLRGDRDSVWGVLEDVEDAFGKSGRQHG